MPWPQCTASDLCAAAFLLGSPTVIHVNPGFYNTIMAHARSDMFAAHSIGPWPEPVPLLARRLPDVAGDCSVCGEAADTVCRNGHGICWGCLRASVLRTYHATSPRCYCGDHYTMQHIVAAIGRAPAGYDVQPVPPVEPAQDELPLEQDPDQQAQRAEALREFAAREQAADAAPLLADDDAAAPPAGGEPEAPAPFVPPPPPPMPPPRAPALPPAVVPFEPQPIAQNWVQGELRTTLTVPWTPRALRVFPGSRLSEDVSQLGRGFYVRNGARVHDRSERLRHRPSGPADRPSDPSSAPARVWSAFRAVITRIRGTRPVLFGQRQGPDGSDPGRRFVPEPQRDGDGNLPIDRTPVNRPRGPASMLRSVETEDDLVRGCRREMELATCFSEAGPARASRLRNAGAQFLKRKECARVVAALDLSPAAILTRAMMEPTDINLVGHCQTSYTEREIAAMDLHNAYIRQHRVLVCGVPTSLPAIAIYGTTFALQHGKDANLRWVGLAMCFGLRKQAPRMAAAAYGAAMGAATLPITTKACAFVAATATTACKWTYVSAIPYFARVALRVYASAARWFFCQATKSVKDLANSDLSQGRLLPVARVLEGPVVRHIETHILNVTTRAYALRLFDGPPRLALPRAQLSATFADEMVLSERRVAVVSFTLSAVFGVAAGYCAYHFIVRPTRRLRE